MDVTPEVVVRLIRGNYPRKVSISSNIDEETSREVVEAFNRLERESNEPIIVEINSDGGRLEKAAFLIAECITKLRSSTVAVVYGQCYSAAFILLQVCTYRYTVVEAHFVIHNSLNSLLISPDQNPDDLSKVAKRLLQRTKDNRERTVSILGKRLTHFTRGEIIEMMDLETHLDAFEAMSRGMVDGIVTVPL